MQQRGWCILSIEKTMATMLAVDTDWTLFLDRDGVINRRLPGDYVRKWEEFEFLEGVLPALRMLAGLFGRIVVVSNQQGIGKGLMTEKELKHIHSQMQREVEAAGGRIDAVYFCPGLARDRPPCRKPDTGMALQAREDFPEIDFARSVMAGDTASDMEFGSRLGAVNVLIGEDEETLARLSSDAFQGVVHYRFGGLYAFALACGQSVD